jgi:hypothetical protein
MRYLLVVLALLGSISAAYAGPKGDGRPQDQAQSNCGHPKC